MNELNLDLVIAQRLLDVFLMGHQELKSLSKHVELRVRRKVGNQAQSPDPAVIDKINELLEGAHEGFELRK